MLDNKKAEQVYEIKNLRNLVSSGGEPDGGI
jgi:hypothetical protein